MNRFHLPGELRPVFRRCLAGVLVALLAGAAAHAQQTVLEVVPLRYRTAAEVIPILQPMLAREGSLSGFQGQLVVRTTPANLEEIKRVLASLDTAPRQLVITVRQDAEGTRSRSAAEASGSVGGDHGRVTVPGGGDPRGGGSVVLRDGDDSVRLDVREGSGSQADRNTQSVRVMEGREAFLRIGQSVPVRERQVQRSVVGGRVVEQTIETTQFREAADGIYVLPRVSGDRVTLDISAQRESLSRAHGGVNVQGVVTTVSGRLGEWIEIGGVSRDSSAQQSALLGRTATAARDSRRVLIKVEEAR
jgi:Bacterial type II and III secretion system protein/Bacterial type II/III secretion system short domain